MVETIGVRELKNQASRVLRKVREEMAEYIVTVHGEPVAVLRPLTDDEVLRLREIQTEKAYKEMKALAQEIAVSWKSDKSGVELIAEQRR